MNIIITEKNLIDIVNSKYFCRLLWL